MTLWPHVAGVAIGIVDAAFTTAIVPTVSPTCLFACLVATDESVVMSITPPFLAAVPVVIIAIMIVVVILGERKSAQTHRYCQS
ncbi:MAG: hypothetical protein ACJ71N_00090 [Terriglobales bacterium]